MQYHGTTVESAIELLSDGIKERAIWNCSEENDLYVWEENETYEANYGDDEDVTNEAAIRNAFESGKCALAFSVDPQKIAVVLEFDFPLEVLENDYSCDNMAGSGAKVVDLEPHEYLQYLKSIKWRRHNHHTDIFTLASLCGNPNFNKYEVDAQTLILAESITEFPDDILDEGFDEFETIDVAGDELDLVVNVLKGL